MLRLGCFGCLTLLVLVTALGLLAWGLVQVTRTPDLALAGTSAADGFRAQQKIFELVRRGGSGRAHTTSLSEGEVNAFLERHLAAAAALPLRRVAVRLPADGRAEIAGQLPLRELLSQAPFSALAGVIPAAWMERSVWLSLRARVTLEGTDRGPQRRHLHLDVERCWIGRLPVPALMLRLLLDPSALRLLRWPVPAAIDGLRVEPGRLVIQAAS